MPDHAPVALLSSTTGRSGLAVVALPAGTTRIIVRTVTLPPLARVELGDTQGPVYGLGHYNLRINAFPSSLWPGIFEGGPLRYIDHGIDVQGKHYSTLRVFEQAGGVYEVYCYS